jgi:SRSO17 transposase
MVADWSGSLLTWEAELQGLKARIGPVFSRAELRETAGAFIDGLLSGVERKTGWLMAEHAGLTQPCRMQSLLGRSRWSADALGEVVRAYAFDALGDADGVLAVDETGFVKKGDHSVGVARQHCATTGRIENAQVGVFLAYASRFGQALIDRRLYLPESWAGDAERRAKAHVPEEVAFAAKIAMARELIAAALDAGAPCRWVLADGLYGGDHRLRGMLEERRQPYVLTLGANQPARLWRREGRAETDLEPAAFTWSRRHREERSDEAIQGPKPAAPGSLRCAGDDEEDDSNQRPPAPSADAADLSAESWTTLAAGEGAKGLRLYDWARIASPWSSEADFEHWLLIRRNREPPRQRAYYSVFAPKGAALAELAGAASLRWTIEECFERAKNDLGLDHCEARSWHGWHRHVTLVMAAAAFLAKLDADLRRSAFGKANARSPADA